MSNLGHHPRIAQVVIDLDDLAIALAAALEQSEPDPLPEHVGKLRRVAGARQRQLAAADEAPGRLDADGTAIVDADAGDLAILDDVDAAAVGAAGVAPGDGVMSMAATRWR